MLLYWQVVIAHTVPFFLLPRSTALDFDQSRTLKRTRNTLVLLRGERAHAARTQQDVSYEGIFRLAAVVATSRCHAEQVRLHLALALHLHLLQLLPVMAGDEVHKVLSRLDALGRPSLFHPRRSVHRIAEEAEPEVLCAHNPAHAAAAVYAHLQGGAGGRRLGHIHLPCAFDDGQCKFQQRFRIPCRRLPHFVFSSCIDALHSMVPPRGKR
mmetsp:Transcript_31087/g.66913  ORF Transcript_31087/g.66913 Transcript_31087/m.66913 type:complete len:211 (-) Transcript_31087:206-838(-)